MKDLFIEVRRSSFPFNLKTFVKIGDNPVFSVYSGDSKEILLKSEGDYEIEVRSFWIVCKRKITLNNYTPILKIDFALPDTYFIISAFIIIPIAILSLIGVIKPFVSGLATLLFLLPILYYTFFSSKRYFKINTMKRSD
jgi:hypothetical protein